jgi:hypothetical protein
MVESSTSSSPRSSSQQNFAKSRINPYTQRSVIPLQQRTPTINTTTTSTITGTDSSTSNNATKTSEHIRLTPLPHHHHHHRHRNHPSPTALNEYDIDDAMIDEYAACYDNDKPRDEFDDTLLFGDGDYEHVQSSSLQQTLLANKKKSEEYESFDTKTTLAPLSLSRAMVTFREEFDDDGDGDDKDTTTLTSVRQTQLDAPSIASQRKDLYKFER